MYQKRYHQLLQILSDEYQPAETIAGQLSVSSKTVRNLLRTLQSQIKPYGAQIQSKPGCGFRLHILNKTTWQNFIHSYTETIYRFSLPQSTPERVQYLLEYLIYSKDYIKIDTLCTSLYIGRRTISNDLKQVEKILQKYDITLLRKPNYGIKITGTEFNLRLCIANLILQNSTHKKTAHEKNTAFIASCILDTLQESQLQLSDIALQNLVIHIYIAIKRIEEKHYMPAAEKWSKPAYNKIEYTAAKKIAAEVGHHFSVDFPESEVCYIALHLAAKRTFEISLTSTDNIIIDHETHTLVAKMLQLVYDAFKFDFRDDLELQMALCLHLIPLKIRVQCDMNLKNPLLTDIKERFTLAYTMAAHASSVFNRCYKKTLMDDEIGYIALSFALALERKSKGLTKKNILLVCASGKGSAKLLEYQYRAKFKDQLGALRTCDSSSLANEDFTHIDYVFTTIPLSIKVPVPVMEIRHFLDEKDIRKVKEKLSFAKTDIFNTYFRQELFLAHISAVSKETIIKTMCDCVHKHLDIPDCFYNAVMKREKLAATSFGNRAAMPHPYWIISSHTFVCVGLLDKPILWNEAEVQVVFLISLGSSPDDQLQTFYQMIAKFLLSKEYIDQLLKTRQFEQLRQTFNKIACEMED